MSESAFNPELDFIRVTNVLNEHFIYVRVRDIEMLYEATCKRHYPCDIGPSGMSDLVTAFRQGADHVTVIGLRSGRYIFASETKKEVLYQLKYYFNIDRDYE